MVNLLKSLKTISDHSDHLDHFFRTVPLFPYTLRYTRVSFDSVFTTLHRKRGHYGHYGHWRGVAAIVGQKADWGVMLRLWIELTGATLLRLDEALAWRKALMADIKALNARVGV